MHTYTYEHTSSQVARRQPASRQPALFIHTGTYMQQGHIHGTSRTTHTRWHQEAGVLPYLGWVHIVVDGVLVAVFRGSLRRRLLLTGFGGDMKSVNILKRLALRTTVLSLYC